MSLKALLTGPVVILALCTAPAEASICQGKSMSLDETVDAIKATRGCERAMQVFTDCAYTASGDVQLGAAVEKKCERDFLGRLGATQTRAYQHEMGVCDRKYANETGTMYRSFTAFCRAEVAQRYSRRVRKASGSSR